MTPRQPSDDRALRIAALAVGVAAALPIGYLVWRTFEYGFSASVDVATSGRTLGLLWSTLKLAVAVTASSVVIAVPIAWLTVRTNLPGRQVWSIVTVLPLAIPTYVGSWAFIGALGPRGMFASLLGIESIPSIYGFGGHGQASRSSPTRMSFSRFAPLGCVSTPASKRQAECSGDHRGTHFSRLSGHNFDQP